MARIRGGCESIARHMASATQRLRATLLHSSWQSESRTRADSTAPSLPATKLRGHVHFADPTRHTADTVGQHEDEGDGEEWQPAKARQAIRGAVRAFSAFNVRSQNAVIACCCVCCCAHAARPWFLLDLPSATRSVSSYLQALLACCVTCRNGMGRLVVPWNSRANPTIYCAQCARPPPTLSQHSAARPAPWRSGWHLLCLLRAMQQTCKAHERLQRVSCCMPSVRNRAQRLGRPSWRRAPRHRCVRRACSSTDNDQTDVAFCIACTRMHAGHGVFRA